MGLELSFAYSSDDISQWEKHFSKGLILGEGNTAVLVTAVFRTREEVAKRVLPPPLEPSPNLIGVAYVVEYPRTNLGVGYSEASLYLFAQYKGEPGRYCFSSSVTNDIALIVGREIYGFPYKMAEKIAVEREGNKVTGVCIRKGIPIIEIKVNLTRPREPHPPLPPWYLFKYFPHPNLRHYGWTSESTALFDYNPRLIKFNPQIDWGVKAETGEAQLALAKSKYDPLHEIPVEEVLWGSYYEGAEIRLLAGEVVEEIDPVKFRPYSFSRLL